MTSRRIYLSMFVTISWFFLNGFNSSVNNELLNRETQKTEAKFQAVNTRTASQKLLESGQVQDKVSSVATTLQKIKPVTVDGPDMDAAQNHEFERHLDLSLPFKTTENNSLKVEKKSAAQSGESNIFASETREKSRKFEVDGDFLMTPNPEAEKIKSVDGAGIVIKVKP